MYIYGVVGRTGRLLFTCKCMGKVLRYISINNFILLGKKLPTLGAIVQRARQAVQQGCCVGCKIGFMRGHGVCFNCIRVHRVPFSCKELRKNAISEISYQSILASYCSPKSQSFIIFFNLNQVVKVNHRIQWGVPRQEWRREFFLEGGQ